MPSAAEFMLEVPAAASAVCVADCCCPVVTQLLGEHSPGTEKQRTFTGSCSLLSANKGESTQPIFPLEKIM